MNDNKLTKKPRKPFSGNFLHKKYTIFSNFYKDFIFMKVTKFLFFYKFTKNISLHCLRTNHLQLAWKL